MQFYFPALVKFTVFAILMANTMAVIALPEPVGLYTRQDTCFASICTPGSTDECCAGTTCTSANLLTIKVIGLCTPASCSIICSDTVPCCTDVPGTTFTCESILGNGIGVCIPKNQ